MADYVNAGGFAWAGTGTRALVLSDPAEAVAQARQWVAQGRPAEAAAQARQWDAQGRPAVGKNKSRAPQNLKPSQGWES